MKDMRTSKHLFSSKAILIGFACVLFGISSLMPSLLYSRVAMITSLILLVSCLSSFLLRRFRGVYDKKMMTGYLLASVTCLMSIFAYLMVPFYHFMCAHLDIGGKVRHYSRPQVALLKNVLKSPGSMKEVAVMPVVTINGNTPIEVDLGPRQGEIKVGRNIRHLFVVTNPSNQPQDIRVRMSIAPSGMTHFVREVSDFNNHVIHFKAHEKRHFTAVFSC